MGTNILAYRTSLLIRHWLEKKASRINHKEVVKDIYLEVDITAGYFLVLTLANLIALSGLITNNTAVIIGAMLISPLMGPILSSGFSFITGDSTVGRKALKKLSLSLVVTIAIAAAATFVSPLKDVTDEILVRTRPNLYDLAVAVFAGTAGAIALCKKKNYVTIVPGVAIATAVIPPLSVTGYGIGSLNFYIAAGGFFLFFTNFVAIVMSTCVIFYLYGFRPSMVSREKVSEMKLRFAGLFLILFVISIPLIYTLHTSISEVRLRGSIQSLLKHEFDRERVSRLDAFSYKDFEDGAVSVKATVNTISYMKEMEIRRVEKGLSGSLGREVSLDVEQVLVQSGGLKEEPVKTTPLPAIVAQKPTEEETNRKTVESAGAFARKVSREIDKIISPSTVTEFYMGFREGSAPLPVFVRIKRDAPLTGDQTLWLGRLVSESMKMPVELTVEVLPFVAPMVFGDGDTDVSAEIRGELSGLKTAFEKEPEAISFKVESFPGTSEVKRDRNWLAKKRSDGIKDILVSEYGIPVDRVKTVTYSRTEEAPTVRVRVLTQ